MMSVWLLASGIILAPPEPGAIVIPAPAPVAGIVVDEQGQPVAGAELFRSAAIGGLIFWRGRSDAHGKFLVDRTNGVVEGPTPSAGFERLVVYQPGMRPASHQLPDWSESVPDAPVRIVLHPVKGIQVRVLDPNGAPVGGATVQLLGTKIGGLPDELSKRLTATTDADGRAHLTACNAEDVPSCRVSARRFGTQMVWWADPAKAETVFTLNAVGRLTGRVTADDREASRGVKIIGMTLTRGPDGRSRGVGRFETTTDAEGRFNVPELAAGGLFVGLDDPERSIIVQRPPADQVLESGKQVEVQYVLAPGLPVRGVLREQGTGRPIARALILVRDSNLRTGPSRRARTDADGRFEVFLKAGSIQFRLLYAGPFVLDAASTQGTATIPKGVEAFDLPPIELVRGAVLRVIVRDEKGEPVAGAAVSGVFTDGQIVRSSSSILRNRVTNERGEFSLSQLPLGENVEVIASKGDAASGPPRPVLPDAPEPVTLVISPESTMSLGGRVLDEHGKPVAGAKVSIRARRRTSSGAEVPRYPSGFLNVGEWNLRTDAEGRFQTPRRLLRYEEHMVYATATGMQEASSEWFAPTTPSFFDLTMFHTPPAEQAPILAHYAAGWTAFKRGDLASAETRFQAAVTEAERLGVKEPVALAGWLTSLGDVRWRLGKNDEAEALVRRALQLREQALGPTHSSVTDTLCLLAHIRRSQGKADEAEALFRKALAASERAQGQGTVGPDYARTLSHLGGVELSQKRYAEAEADLSRALAILENTLGREHRDLLTPLEYRALALWGLWRLDEAEALYRRALTLAEKVGGDDASQVGRMRENLAKVLRANGKAAEAEALQPK